MNRRQAAIEALDIAIQVLSATLDTGGALSVDISAISDQEAEVIDRELRAIITTLEKRHARLSSGRRLRKRVSKTRKTPY